MSMKVLYDFQIFGNQQFGGISRYFAELMREFRRTGIMDTELGVKYTTNHYLEVDEFWKSKIFPPKHISLEDSFFGINFPGKDKLYPYFGKLFNTNIYKENRKLTTQLLQQGSFEIFHPTYYDPYFLPYIKEKPFVLTVYDMIHEIYPDLLDPKSTIAAWKAELCDKATRIIAISEQTKEDLVALLRIEPAKIEVIHLANSLNPELSNPQLQLPQKYVLFVGMRKFYKNFDKFIHGMLPLLAADPDLRVVAAGGGAPEPAELEYLRGQGVVDKIVFVSGDDASLVTAYKGALAYVCPSLYEGFGIPLLEAFACGTPVIASNSSSLPEVGADAAAYFDPQDIVSIGATIKQVIYDEARRQGMIARGHEREKLFSWERTAMRTAELYKVIIG